MYEESGRWSDIGYIERTEVEVSDIKSSERVLARTVDEGMFAPADSGTADRVDYFDSSSDWDSYLKRRTNRRFVGDQVLLSRAMARLDGGEDCLRTHIESWVGVYSKKACNPARPHPSPRRTRK